METEGIYIYGIIPNIYHSDTLNSLEDTGVYSIPFQDISAIVSDRNKDCVDFSNRESLGYLLVEHQETIEEISKKGFTMILPMRLGVMVSSKESVINILANGYNLITETLKKVENLTEMDMVVTWVDFPNHIEEIVAHEDIQKLKQEILSKNDSVSQVDQVKIGMLIQEKMSEQNKQIELKALNDLSIVTEDIKIHEVMNDQMISNVAFLINKNKLEKFEKIVTQIDEEYNGKLNFKLVGPLPNYSFYTIDIKELKSDLIVEAKNLLELETIGTEKEIKNAYLKKAKSVHPDTQPNANEEAAFNKFNQAYHLLLEYTQAYKCATLNEFNLQLNSSEINNLILVKIRE